MTVDAQVTVPRNVGRFEIFMYASLLLDTLSAAIQGAPDSATGASDPVVNFINAIFILFFVFLVGFAARKRQNWARMTLLAALALAVVSILGSLSDEGLRTWTAIDVISTILTAFGLYASFTGDAKGWFDQPRS